ncbi:uncharacterized protein [Coffea arabica]|uniref:Uncharacterized protein n=1 Tax=Coffea arabica TaxID=13443 RepID=A0A6P6S8E5_COFAR|nr:uncharacterized protein LOC113688833 isoform X1 [Coffea arabica]
MPFSKPFLCTTVNPPAFGFSILLKIEINPIWSSPEAFASKQAMKEMAQTRRLNKECEEPTFGVGSIGKVRVLMMQELDSVSSRRRPTNATVPVSVYCCEKRRRSVQVKKTKSDQRNSTSTGCKSSILSSDTRRSSGISSRKKVHNQSPSAQSIPMLESEDISLERTPARGCQERRKTRIVEIVDLKCGNSGKGWSSPITDQLRRLSFSKLSD